MQRFGAALNAHTHLHCCVTDGVFGLEANDTLRFYPVTDCALAAISAMQRRIRTRVLRTAVRVEAQDRAGLERLLRALVDRFTP